MGEPRAVVGAGTLERLDDGAHRQRQVGAGVAVGDRVDVEVVDPRRRSASIAASAPRASSSTRSLMRVTLHVLDDDLDRGDR